MTRGQVKRIDSVKISEALINFMGNGVHIFALRSLGCTGVLRRPSPAEVSEAGNSGRLGVEGFKHSDEFRDYQQVLQAVVRAEQLYAPA